MPSYSREIRISGKSASDLYAKISNEIENFLKKTPLKGYTINKIPQQNRIQLESSMADLTLDCQEEKLALHGKLSLMAMPFKGSLDSAIDRWIEKTFG